MAYSFGRGIFRSIHMSTEEFYQLPKGCPELAGEKLQIVTVDSMKTLEGFFRRSTDHGTPPKWKVSVVIPRLMIDGVEGEREIFIGPEVLSALERTGQGLRLRCTEATLGDTPVPPQFASPA
jgi:hypothetical protein